MHAYVNRSAALSALSLALLLSGCGGGGYGDKRGGYNPLPPQYGTVQFGAGSLSIDENAGTATLTIARTSGSDGAVSVTLASSDGSASAGQDYTALGTTVSFAAGDAVAKTVTIAIADDTQSEADETFTVALSAPTGGATVGATATVALTIRDNDAPAAPALHVGADIKQLRFSWEGVAGATTYRLLQSPDGLAYTQVGADLPATATSASLDISVHRHDWVNARYRLEACNAHRCAGSTVAATDAMLDAIGYFKATAANQHGSYGRALALSADGNTLAIGAPNEDDGEYPIGAVNIFARTPDHWSLQAHLVVAGTDVDIGVGWSLALSDDGNTLAVGAPWNDTGDRPGAVYVFTRSATQWSSPVRVEASSHGQEFDFFGWSVALNADGRTLAVGAPLWGSGVPGDPEDVGAAYAFALGDDGRWSQQAYLQSADVHSFAGFGTTVDLSADGNTLAVGTPRQRTRPGVSGGAVHLFARNGSTWSPPAQIQGANAKSGDEFGGSLALSADGNLLVVGAPGRDRDDPIFLLSQEGAVYIFTREATGWVESAHLLASNAQQMDFFGRAVALSADGRMLAVFADGEDSDALGVDGNQGDASPGFDAGAVYVFLRAGAEWTQSAYVKAANTGATDAFGAALAFSADGSTLAVSAVCEDGSATGIGGDRSKNDALDAGAVYLY